MTREQVFEFFRRLAEENPSPTTELEFENPYTLLVAVVLYANGAAKWVARDTIDDQLKHWLATNRSPYFFTDTFNMMVYDRVWNNLDAETQLTPGVPQQ